MQRAPSWLETLSTSFNVGGCTLRGGPNDASAAPAISALKSSCEWTSAQSQPQGRTTFRLQSLALGAHVGNDVLVVQEKGQSSIQRRACHRLKNPGDLLLVFFELRQVALRLCLHGACGFRYIETSSGA